MGSDKARARALATREIKTNVGDWAGSLARHGDELRWAATDFLREYVGLDPQMCELRQAEELGGGQPLGDADALYVLRKMARTHELLARNEQRRRASFMVGTYRARGERWGR